MPAASISIATPLKILQCGPVGTVVRHLHGGRTATEGAGHLYRSRKTLATRKSRTRRKYRKQRRRSTLPRLRRRLPTGLIVAMSSTLRLTVLKPRPVRAGLFYTVGITIRRTAIPSSGCAPAPWMKMSIRQRCAPVSPSE